jgi:hypothetical protein
MVLLQHKRDEMFHYLQALANPDYQQRVWVNGEYLPEIGHDGFGYVITFFFEDTMLAEAPQNNVGTILESPDEVPLIANVCDALANVVHVMGDDRTDAEYIRSPHWRAVVMAAADAIEFYSQAAGH